MSKLCKDCGKPLLNTRVEICLDCSMKSLRQTFLENPDIKQAYKETLDELSKPENIKKMGDELDVIIYGLLAFHQLSKEKKL